MKVGTPPFCRKTDSPGQWQQRQQRRRPQLDRRLAGNSAPDMACETNSERMHRRQFWVQAFFQDEAIRTTNSTRGAPTKRWVSGYSSACYTCSWTVGTKRVSNKYIYYMYIYIYILRSASRRSVVRVYKNVSLVQCLGMGFEAGRWVKTAADAN